MRLAMPWWKMPKVEFGLLGGFHAVGFINLIDFGWIKRTRGAIRRRSGSQ